MTRIKIKIGPGMREPRSLADQLAASVDYNDEAERQRRAQTQREIDDRRIAEVGDFPTEEQLRVVHEDLDAHIGKTRWVVK